MTQKQPLEVRFVADEDVLDHIVEKQQDIKAANGSVQTLVTLKTPQKSKRSEAGEDDEDDEDEGMLNEQNYVDALCTGSQGDLCVCVCVCVCEDDDDAHIHLVFLCSCIYFSMGFNILIYGLGSKKLLLEKFRTSMLSDFDHVVVNGFFPSMTLKSILNSLTCDVFGHEGTFRNPADQIDFIIRTLREDPSNHVFLIIHNIDGPMLRGDRTQQALGQLAALPNMHLLASIDHINAPLIWDQAKMSMFNWLWYETTTYLPYTEETSYENSLLVQQTGALALSSLTHVLRSLTPNARGIFRLLAEFQLENKDNPAYTGLSFQDFYQRCRESFLVNSDITLRTQLTEFRDHKLIRNKKGADGVEYLLIPVDNGTLTDFLEKNDVE
uniref:Origin recognition complex subunit 2 n=1 Tax=Cyprinus carpio TaxID=7962 RepID=A0A8C2BEX8_CYPCA